MAFRRHFGDAGSMLPASLSISSWCTNPSNDRSAGGSGGGDSEHSSAVKKKGIVVEMDRDRKTLNVRFGRGDTEPCTHSRGDVTDGTLLLRRRPFEPLCGIGGADIFTTRCVCVGCGYSYRLYRQ